MPETKRPLKVFLCHASADKPKVRELYRYLRRRGIKPWFDEMDLIGGQDWQVEIPRAITTSDAIIICLTKNSIDKEGYVQKEIKFALDKALEMPEGRIYLIPVRFEECEVPFSLSRYQWVDLFDEIGFTRLMRSLKTRAGQLERANVQIPKPDDSSPDFSSTSEEKAALENAEHEVAHKAELEAAEKVARDKTEKDVLEKARLEAEELTRQKIAEEKAEREAAEKVAREKAEKDAIEKARLEAEELAKQKVVKEKTEREAARKAAQEKTKRDAVEKAKREKTERQTARKAALAKAISNFRAKLKSTLPKAKPFLKIGGVIVIVFAFILIGIQVIPGLIRTYPEEIKDSKNVSMRLIPAGNFKMGSNDVNVDEKPLHTVYLSAYYIDKFEVTNELYRICMQNFVCPNLDSYSSSTRSFYYGNPEFSDYPVIGVSWQAAKTYCEWRNARLPTEAEWEKAARGVDGRNYPWGDNVDATYANYSSDDTTIVGSYETGKSPYSVYDMAGNVSEWVSSNYYLYPYKANDGRETIFEFASNRIFRGGDFRKTSQLITTFGRELSGSGGSAMIGFRCAKDVAP